MKTFLALATAVLTFGLMTPSSAEANFGFQQRVVGYTNCGRPIMAFYQVMGYDRCGNPVGQWVTQASPCTCHLNRGRSSFGGNHFGGACPPHHGRSSRSGFFFRFGR
jgi:hypothetical protein